MDWTLRCISVNQTGGKPSICEEITITRFTKTEHVQEMLLAMFAPSSSMLSIVAYDKDGESTRKLFLADVIASLQADAPLAGIQVNGKIATILIAGGIGGSTKLAAQPTTPPIAAPHQAQQAAATALRFKRGRIQTEDPSRSRAGQTDGKIDTAASARLRKFCNSLLRRSDDASNRHSYLPLDQQHPWVVPLLQTCLKRADGTRAYDIDLLMKKVERTIRDHNYHIKKALEKKNNTPGAASSSDGATGKGSKVLSDAAQQATDWQQLFDEYMDDVEPPEEAYTLLQKRHGLCKRQLDDPDAEWEPPSEQDAAKTRKLGRKQRAAMDGPRAPANETQQVDAAKAERHCTEPQPRPSHPPPPPPAAAGDESHEAANGADVPTDVQDAAISEPDAEALQQMKAASEKRATGVRRRRQINIVVDPADQLEGGEADDTLDLQKAAPKGGGQKRGRGSNAKAKKPAAKAQQRPK